MTNKSILMTNLERMLADTAEWETREARYIKVRQNTLYMGIPTKDIGETYQRVLKAKRTFENRLNKARIEWEILNREFKEMVALYDSRVTDATFEEEQRKQETKEIDVRQFIAPVEPKKITKKAAAVTALREFFVTFRKEYVRERRDGYEEVVGEQVTLNDVRRCVFHYADITHNRRPKIEEIQEFCDDVWGGQDITLTNKVTGETKQSRVYHHLRVFLEKEDVELFDKEHENIFDD